MKQSLMFYQILFLTKIICDNQDLPWMICHIKNLILYNDICKTFARGKNSLFFEEFTKLFKLIYPNSSTKLFKACVGYFLTIFFSPNYSPSKSMKNVFLFHLKSSFRSRDIQIFVFFPFLSTLSRLKRTNGSGIIYDAMNWLA